MRSGGAGGCWEGLGGFGAGLGGFATGFGLLGALAQEWGCLGLILGFGGGYRAGRGGAGLGLLGGFGGGQGSFGAAG